jgi:hypothetical protein
MNNNKLLVSAATAAVLVLTLSGCKLGGAEKTPQHCVVGDRSTTDLRVDCYRNDNNQLLSKQNTGTPSDLYPKCQIGQPWPECKEK